CRRKINGNKTNTPRNTRYQTSGSVAREGSNRLKCQAHSRAVRQTRPTAGSHSNKNSLVTPSSSTHNNNAKPNTGDGSARGKRSVAIISSRNGRMAESVGNCAARFADANRSSPDLLAPRLKDSGSTRRASQTPTPTKKIVNAPSRIKEVGKPVRVAGILRINAAVAPSVKTSTTTMGIRERETAARPMASKSTSSTKGQTRKDTSSNRKIGRSTSSNANGGKI